MLNKLIKACIVCAAISCSLPGTAQQRKSPILFGQLNPDNTSATLSGVLKQQSEKALLQKDATGVSHTGLAELSKQIAGKLKGVTPLLTSGNRIGVQLLLREKDQRSLRILEAAGLEITSQSDFVINGFIDPVWVGTIESLPMVKMVNPVMGVGTAIGSTTTQGDRALRSDIVRTIYGVTGAGVKIGVISDSYNRSGQGAQNSVTSGNLPGAGNPNGFTKPVQVVSDRGLVSTTDEGRGMLEIIHDIAPGAELAFADAGDFSQQGFANAINALRNAGCKIIVDDVFNLSEPVFQDGLANRAIDNFSAAGGIYFTIAGNFARQSYEAPFKNANLAGAAGGRTHNFAASGVDNTQRITLAPGAQLVLLLHWSDRYASVNGGQGATADLGINIFDAADGSFLGSSAGSNIGGDPVDFIILGNGDDVPFVLDLQIEVKAGTTPARIKYTYLAAGNVAFNEYRPGNGPVAGHLNAATAITCGAADYRFTPIFGTPLPVLESFSSAGGMTVTYNTNGQVINAVRRKPEIVSVDNGNTSFFPLPARLPNADIDGDGFPNFPGTSAAAPHAAAVAALLKQAIPTATAAQIKNWFISSCQDMDDPAIPGFQTGFDFGTGNGLLRADLAFFFSGALPIFVLPRTGNTAPATTKAIPKAITGTTAIRVAPNPVDNVLQLTVPDVGTMAAYRITDANGRLLLSGILRSTTNTIDVSKLASGFYQVMVSVDQQIPQTLTFIKG